MLREQKVDASTQAENAALEVESLKEKIRYITKEQYITNLGFVRYKTETSSHIQKLKSERDGYEREVADMEKVKAILQAEIAKMRVELRQMKNYANGLLICQRNNGNCSHLFSVTVQDERENMQVQLEQLQYEDTGPTRQQNRIYSLYYSLIYNQVQEYQERELLLVNGISIDDLAIN